MRKELADFAAHWGERLTFAGLHQGFYDGLRNYMLGVAGRSPRTFNTYVKRLRSFLFWAENQDLPVPPRFRKVLKLAQSYVGKEALAQDKLLRLATIDFTSPTVQSYLTVAFPEPEPKAAGSGDYLQHCEWTRDTFLLCAYTSLRHGDAQELGWQHVHREQELIKKALNKTTIVGLIPYLDDVFRPMALLEQYHPLAGTACLPLALPAPHRGPRPHHAP